MPQYPTPGAYQEALQFPQTAFTDADLQAAEPVAGPLGLPQAITGAFAAVFPVHTPSGRHALKCFVTEVPDQQARYRAISKYLESERAAPALPYLAPFEYQPKGIRVGDRLYPLLKMGWVQGMPLNRFVAEHLGDADLLNALAEQWAALLAALEAAGIAHGDLQHGNVLVAENEDGLHLRLVDYDTLYVPPLKGRKSPEAGHRNYQHPDRSARDFGPYLDRFAGLVIYTALRAVALRPELWARYDTGENLLFRAADFYDPASSPLFKDLDELPELAPLVDALRAACLIEPQAIPPLADILGGARVKGGPRTALNAARRASRTEEERTPAARLFLPLAAVWLIAALMLTALAHVTAALAVLAAGAVVLAWMAAGSYRASPVNRRRRRLAGEVAFFEAAIVRLRREIAELETEARKVADSADTLRARRLRDLRDGILHRHLKHHFIDEIEYLPGIPHKLVTRLKLHGIRTAYHASDERVAGVPEIGERTKGRVAHWRAELIQRHVPELPETLSPAEERRLERHVQQHLETTRAEIARLHERIRVQERERREVEARRAALPGLSFGRFLRYLLHLAPLPSSRVVPPRPSAPPPATSAVPAPEPEDAPWWKQHNPA